MRRCPESQKILLFFQAYFSTNPTRHNFVFAKSAGCCQTLNVGIYTTRISILLFVVLELFIIEAAEEPSYASQGLFFSLKYAMLVVYPHSQMCLVDVEPCI
jgi:hypothetical protein